MMHWKGLEFEFINILYLKNTLKKQRLIISDTCSIFHFYVSEWKKIGNHKRRKTFLHIKWILFVVQFNNIDASIHKKIN